MTRTLLAGLAAGAAGTTALNLVSYLDMLVRARPASTTPEETVRRAEGVLHLSLAADEPGEAAANRRTALGAVLGCGAGLATGVAYGLVRPRLGRVPLVALCAGAGLAANIGTTAPMVLLGVTDPRTWSASSWLADFLPHLAYGLAVAGSFELMWQPPVEPRRLPSWVPTLPSARPPRSALPRLRSLVG
jgi:hypothetical protein